MSVSKSTGNVGYTYDAGGNRISKTVAGTTTVYVRDATGNVMSVYQIAGSAVGQTETHLYGSSRLGMETALTVASTSVAMGNGGGKLYTFTRGEKLFELNNHLGNVLATVTDKKIGVSGGGTIVDYYTPDIASSNDYYPFGMAMPGRSFSAGTLYRYWFNGKEKNDEVANGDYDFGARIQDSRLGRWLSIDPLQKKYPGFTPYSFTMNNPIFFSDVDGKDVGVSIVGNTITFTSTTYVDGVDAAAKVELFNAAFKKFVEANTGLKSSDGKWNVQIKMNFVDASTVKDHVIANQEMASENYMNIKNPTPGNARASSGMRLAGSRDENVINDIDPNGNNGKGMLLGTSSEASGRFAQLYTKDNGRTGVHEELHNWGLGDYYADVVYDSKTYVNDKLYKEVTGASQKQGQAVPYAGFEGTIMSTGNGLKLAQENVDDLVNTALKTSEIKKSTNFVMARVVDSGRPHGNRRDDQVPKTKTTTTGGGSVKTVSTNPQYKSAGN